jgi:hypothetical protein
MPNRFRCLRQPVLAPWRSCSQQCQHRFDSAQGDQIILDHNEFGGIATVKLKTVGSRTALKKAASSASNLIYSQSDNGLYFNANGNAVGFGEGGVFVCFEGQTRLIGTDLVLA